MNFKALDEYNNKHYPRADWPISITYLDFKTLGKYEKLFPQAD
jgi:hypothetical protein